MELMMDSLTKRLKTFGLTAVTFVLMAAPALAQGAGPGPGPGAGPGFHGGHPMMAWGGRHFAHGHGWGWGAGGGFILLLALIGFIVVVLAVVRALLGGRHRRHYRGMGMGAGLEIVETRYARGEIGRDEYLEKRRDLTGRA
jgi:putative membrane protein